ncbi:alkaline phosphatase [Brevibacterium sp. S111]|uniref:alkaline phosphatase n=1 Tax=unclassified Brevibacterium TaxID=2614124 RepID=UPI0010808A7E|nr:alkaline phosphatase [Brevibacterium sp. S111]TGD13092.1 alkaline phosphatase [Brevibacterium sp. S111]
MARRTLRIAAATGALSFALFGVASPAQASGIDEPGGARQLDGDNTDAIRDAVEDSGAKNVILLIGDGMGDSEITAARNYAKGAHGRFDGLDALPMTGQYTTYAVDKDTGKPDYVTDSAASATGWSSGTKTYNGALGIDRKGNPHKTLIEMARAKGMKTGDVSTAEIQDATPAAQLTHISLRGCYGPEETSEDCSDEALENGGLGSISEQIINARADVTLGGGSASFEQKATAGDWKDQTLLEQAEDRGYQLVDDSDSLDSLTEANQDSPVLGLFTEGNFPVRWEGPKATHGGGTEPAVKCKNNPERTSSVPKLDQLTNKAVDLLDNDDGFFLQVEGASIDKEDHAANPCGQIGETVDLDEAVKAALDFAKEDGETLVITTADHAHTSQIVSAGSDTPGLTRTLTTADGTDMTMNYATADEEESQGHTGTQLRIAAYGPGAANVVGLTDQTDMHFTIADGLGLDPEAEVPGDPGDDANGDDDSAGTDDANGSATASGSSDTGGDDSSAGSQDSNASEDSNDSNDADAAGGGSGANGSGEGGEGNAGSGSGGEGPGLAGGGGGTLPRTGVEIGAAVFFGVAAIIGGSALIRMAKRRGILPA